MIDYSAFHVETYGHGAATNKLADQAKVTIEDHDGHYYVYECDCDAEASQIAQWFLDSGYDSYPHHVRIEQHAKRRFSVEIVPAPQTLVELADILEEWREFRPYDPASAFAQRNETLQAYAGLDLTDLPTFGGVTPDYTSEVWSWDKDHLLVGSDDLYIVPRADW